MFALVAVAVVVFQDTTRRRDRPEDGGFQSDRIRRGSAISQ
jgi:hypothetical protein